MRAQRTLLALSLSLFGLGCSGDRAPPGGGDAEPVDSEPVDAGVTSDGGPSGRTSDGGLDAAIQDTGILDTCDPLSQNCPNMGDRCVVENAMANAGTECIARGTGLGLNAACSGRDCLPGLACVASSSVSATCTQVCRPSDGVGCEALGRDYDCRRRIVETNWGACTQLAPLCVALDESTCPGGQACQPYLRRNGTWEFRCATAGPQAEGAMCGTSASGMSCMRGLACVQDSRSAIATCRRYCDDNNDCRAPETCVGSVSAPEFRFCAM